MAPSPDRLRSLRGFDQECAAFAQHIESFAPEDLDRLTNCPPWTLHELIVHVVFSITMPDRLPHASQDLPAKTAADYFRRAERDTAPYRTGNVDRARSIAAEVSREELSSRFVDTWKRASATFASHEADERMQAGGLVLTVDSYLLTRLMSVAAHGVDVAITMERPAWTTPMALRSLRPVLVDLLGADPPPTWSDQDHLEIGTGRRQLSDADVGALGPRAALFPLLS